ncbi:hypothetical protein J6590_011881 [Homalodisca vitripennis]|nr:hypothetical protein J6590_011881 [Homalodisca vitripennis]
MPVVDIKKELKSKGLSTAGTKPELVQRLQAANTQAAQDLMLDDGNGDAEMIDEDEVLAGGVDEEEDFDDDDLTADAVLAEEPKAIVPETTVPSAKRPAETPPEPQPKKRVLVRPVSTSSVKENNEQEKINEEIKQEKIDTNEKKIVKLTSVTAKEVKSIFQLSNSISVVCVIFVDIVPDYCLK